MIVPTHQLRSFLAVAELGNYTHAAQRLFLSQPGIYQHVRQLEATFGTKLVEQHGKRVVLTQHGRFVYEYAKKLEQEEAELFQRLRDDESLSGGTVSIAAGSTAGEFLLPRIAVAFQRRYPDIAIRVAVLGTVDEVDRSVLDRRFDLGFHSDPVPREGLTKTPFVQDELVGIAPPGHRFVKSGRRIAARTVATEPFIAFSAPPDAPFSGALIRVMTEEWFADVEEGPDFKLSLGTLEGIKNAVRAGAGVGIVSRYAVRDDDPSLGVFRLARPPRRTFMAVSREGGWEPNVVRAFREFAINLEWLPPEEAEALRVERPAEAPRRSAT